MASLGISRDVKDAERARLPHPTPKHKNSFIHSSDAAERGIRPERSPATLGLGERSRETQDLAGAKPILSEKADRGI